jgi:hypothetical protein
MIDLSANDPELNPRILGRISADFVKVSDQVKEACYLLMQRGISQYPVFSVSDTALSIGALLYQPNYSDLENELYYHFTFMEELIQRGFIADDATEGFVQNFKNPDEYACLLVVLESFSGFVFIPYPED